MISETIKKHLKKLTQKKYREEFRECIVEGVKGVEEVFENEISLNFLIVEEARKNEMEIQKLIDVAQKNKIEIYFASAKDVKEIKTTDTFPGVLAVVPTSNFSLNDFVAAETVLCLDGVKDPGNLGTIIRTADWFGIQNILLSEDCVDPYNEKVVRSTMGSLFRAKIAQSKNIVQDIENLRKDGYKAYALQMKGESVVKIPQQKKSIYVFGSESHGISENVQSVCNESYTIPRFGKTESLNVGIAVAITLAQIKLS